MIDNNHSLFKIFSNRMLTKEENVEAVNKANKKTYI